MRGIGKRAATMGRASAFAALAFLPVLGCDKILGIHDLDAGPAPLGDDGSDLASSGGGSSGSFPGLSSGSSGSGSSGGLAVSTSSSSGGRPTSSNVQCTQPSDCASSQVCCGTTSLTSTCAPRSTGCPPGSLQVCKTTTDCVAAGASCQSYMGIISICQGGQAVSADGGPVSLGFTPSNFNPATLGDAGVDWSNARDTVDGLPSPVATVAMNDANATKADLYVLHSWVVNATSSVTISGENPAIVLVLTTVDIQGPVSVSAGAFQPGAAPGPGGGQTSNGGGGGGGSYCGVGGTGAQMGGQTAAGNTYGTPTLTPILGGSAGGGGCNSPAGGGAIQIVAGSSINIRQYASINAGGFGGCNAAGGGSGGSILLEAPTVQVAGSLAANGGGGGGSSSGSGANATGDKTPALGGGAGNDAGAAVGGNGSAGAMLNGGGGVFLGGEGAGGGGGAGRIRINTRTGSATITGIVSPALGPEDGGAQGGTSCATQGMLNP